MNNVVTTDSRGRFSLARQGVKPGQLYRVAHHPSGRIVLDPVTSYTRSELEESTGRKFSDYEWEAML